jgi:hypothetical protein
MTTPDFATLSLLGDSDLTVADGEEDIRGRTVKARDGTDIGKVDDLLIDKDDRRVRFIRVEYEPLLVTEQKYFGDLAC